MRCRRIRHPQDRHEPGRLDSPGRRPVAATPAVRFVGDRRAYWRLLVRGAVLLAVTLGIYRFWFATDIRRFLWSNTEVAGETLEYTGTALELLIGFLIAIALLVPLYVGFFVVALNLGPAGAAHQRAGLSGAGLSRTFCRLPRPALSADPHHLPRRAMPSGRLGAALRGLRAVLVDAMILLTLGLAYPFAQARLERFKMRHTYYGNLQGRFEGSGSRLFLRGLPMWLLVVGPLVFRADLFRWPRWNGTRWPRPQPRRAAAASSSNQLERQLPRRLRRRRRWDRRGWRQYVTMAALLFPVFQAMMLRWWLSGLRFGALTIRSHLRTGQIYGAYLRFLVRPSVFDRRLAFSASPPSSASAWWLAPSASPRLAEVCRRHGGRRLLCRRSCSDFPPSIRAR